MFRQSERGLPFRGGNQQTGSTSNGLFLGCLKLINKFDPFLSQHLATYGNEGKGNVSYLSSDIYGQFISIMSNRVLHEIIKESHYFSLIIDTTAYRKMTNWRLCCGKCHCQVTAPLSVNAL